LWKSNEISKGSFYGQLAGCHCETPRYPEFVLKALTKGSKPCLSSDNYFTKKYDVTVSTLFGQNIDGAPPPLAPQTRFLSFIVRGIPYIFCGIVHLF